MAFETEFDFEPYYCSPRLLSYAADILQLDDAYKDEVIENHNFYIILATLQKNRSLWQMKQKEIKDSLGLISETKNKIWIEETIYKTLSGKCSDGRNVSQKSSFVTAEFDELEYKTLEKSCRKILDPLALEYPLSLFMRRATFHKIEGSIAEARNNSEKLKNFIASTIFFLRQQEPVIQTKEMIKRWVLWCVDALVKLKLTEEDFKFLLKSFSKLAECVFEDENFDFSWMPVLCQFPDLRSISDPMANCDLALVSFKIICESFERTVKLVSLEDQDPFDEFHVVSLHSCTKCDYYILLLKQIPICAILKDFEDDNHSPAQYFALLSYTWKLINIITEPFNYVQNVSFSKFFCYCSELATVTLDSCARVLTKSFRDSEQANSYFNELFLATVRRFLIAKSSTYLNNEDTENMYNTLGVWKYFEKFDFTKLSNESVHIFISNVCLRSLNSECTCFENPDCVSSHVQEFLEIFCLICSFSIDYVQFEKDGVALLQSLVDLTQVSDQNVSRSGHIVDFVASALWEICFASAKLQKTFCGHGYQLLKTLTSYHPHTIDYFITWTSEHTEDPFIVSVASKIFQYIKLDSWKISRNTIESLAKFLQLPSESSLNPVSRFLLDRINWRSNSENSTSNVDDIDLKLEVVRIVAIRYFDSVNESTERKLAAYFNDHNTKLTEKAEFALWCWQLIPNLDIEIPFGHAMPLVLSQLMSESLNFMHFLPLWIYRNIEYHPMDSFLGFRHLQTLLDNEFYIPAISILDNILFKYDRDTPDAVRNVYRLFDKICHADRTVLGTSANMNTKLLASMVVNFAHNHIDSIGFQVTLKAILTENEFAFNEGLMIIIDHLCNYLFFKQKLLKVIVPKLTDIFLKQYTAINSKGATVKETVASMVSSKVQPYQPIILKPDYRYTYLNYACLMAQINFERIAKFWPSIVEVAKTEFESSADELIYRAKLSSTIFYNCPISAENLAIHFCSRLILQTDPTSFVYLHLWRQLMLMYYYYDRLTDEITIVGDRFFKKLIGFSPIKKMAGAAGKATEVNFSAISRRANYRRGLFLNTCGLWLTSPALKGAPVKVASLTFEHDYPNMMDLIFNKKHSFFQYMEFNYLDVFTDKFFTSLSSILNPDLRQNSTLQIKEENNNNHAALTFANDSHELSICDPMLFQVPPYLEAIKSPYDSIDIESSFEATIERVQESLKHICDYTENSIGELDSFQTKLQKFKTHVLEEYKNHDVTEHVEISCTNMFRKTCSGPALIEWKYSKFEKQSNVTDLISSGIYDLEQKFPLIYMCDLENFVESGEFLSHLLCQLVKTSNSSEAETEVCESFVNGAFFMLVKSVKSEKFLNFAPFSAIFENCLQILGPKCVRNATFCSRILRDMVEKSYLVPLLSSYFDVDKSIFVESYCQILQACSSGSLTAKMSTNLLKKFDFSAWLLSNPAFADMKKLVSALLNYFVKIGRRFPNPILESVPMQHFMAINSKNSETLIEICFPVIFELECQTHGLSLEFYEKFYECCETEHSSEQLPDIVHSITIGLNTNEKVCFKSESDICRNLLKPELLKCIRSVSFQFINSLGTSLDFTTSIHELEASIETAWDNLTQIFDNFWLKNLTTVKRCDPKSDYSFHEHVQTFIQCVNKLQICFHKIRPSLDVGYCGARYKNALNFLIERIAMLKNPQLQDFSAGDSNETSIASEITPTFITEYFETLCWSIFMPSLADMKNLIILFESQNFHALAVQIFVSVNWSAYCTHQSNMNLDNDNEVLHELIQMTLKFYFQKSVLNNVFLVFSEWNMDQESSSADKVTIDDGIRNLEECNWSKLETENLRSIVTQWEQELQSQTELVCAENPFVKLFFSVVETGSDNQTNNSSSESRRACIGKPFVFVETLCRLIYKQGNEQTLEENVFFLLQELSMRYSAKYLRVSLLASIFEQCTKIQPKNLQFLTSAINSFLTSRNLSERDFLWLFEAVAWSISNIAYLCKIGELVIDKYFAIDSRRKSSISEGFRNSTCAFTADWDALQVIIDQTNFSNYKSIFETCAKNGHTYLLYLMSKSTHENSVDYFLQSLLKFDLLVLADQNLDHKLVVVYYRLLNLNRLDDFPTGSSATKVNNPAKAMINLLLQVCDVNIFDKFRAKLGFHASSHFSMDFRIISKCLLIYILRTLAFNLRESSYPKYLNLLDSLRRLLTTFPSASVVDYQLLVDLCVCTDSHQPMFYMLITNFYSNYRALAALLH